MNIYEGGQKKEIHNSLPSAPPIFLRAGYILFTTSPKLRTAKLSNNFNLIGGLLNGKIKGNILALNNYSDDEQINKCVKENCTL
jgi:hypothetical protein